MLWSNHFIDTYGPCLHFTFFSLNWQKKSHASLLLLHLWILYIFLFNNLIERERKDHNTWNHMERIAPHLLLYKCHAIVISLIFFSFLFHIAVVVIVDCTKMKRKKETKEVRIRRRIARHARMWDRRIGMKVKWEKEVVLIFIVTIAFFSHTPVCLKALKWDYSHVDRSRYGLPIAIW